MSNMQNTKNENQKKMISIYKLDTSLDDLNLDEKTPWTNFITIVKGYNNYFPEELNLQQNFLEKFDRVAFKLQSHNSASWVDFVNEFLQNKIDKKDVKSYSHSFLLLIKPKNQENDIFAITFGSLAYYVIQNYIDKDFGLDILSRIIEPNTKIIKSTKGQTVVGATQGQRSVYRQLHTLDDVEDFGKIFQELNVSITKEALNKFGISTEQDFKNCCAKSSFQIKTSIPTSTIENYIDGCLFAKTYPPQAINSTKLLDKKKDEKLISEIIDNVISKTWNDVNQGDAFDLCHKKFDNYIEAEGYKAYYNGEKISIEYGTTLNNLIDKFKINEENFKIFLKKTKIRSFDSDDKKLTEDNLFNHLFLEYIDENNIKYFILNGSIYKIEEIFLDSLDNKIKNLNNNKKFLNNDVYPEWGNTDETGYNSKFNDIDDYIVLHKLLFNNLELCDILRYSQEELYLYFVKDGFKGTIRDLSYQIYNTAKLIENSINTDCKLINEFYNKYKETLEQHFTTSEAFINIFKTKPIKYVFAFRDKNNRSLKDNPSVFQSNVAKFALVDLEEKMKQLNKSELKILQIKNIGS